MTNYSKEQKEAFIKEGRILRKKGYSYEEIARALGVSRRFISPYLTDIKFKSRRTVDNKISGSVSLYQKARTNAISVLIAAHEEEFYKIFEEEKKKLEYVPTYKRIDPETREHYRTLVKELRNQGHTLEYISMKIGYSIPTVRILYFE